MEPVLWTVSTLDASVWAGLFATLFVVLIFFCPDYPILLVYRQIQRTFGIDRHDQDRDALALPLLVVIPSLLRRRDELTSMMSTVRSIADNGYPGDMTIVLTIDGNLDAPHLYEELLRWVSSTTARHLFTRVG